MCCPDAYLDFLRYGWIAQMLNQFEHSHVPVAFNLEVRTCAPRHHGKLHAWPSGA